MPLAKRYLAIVPAARYTHGPAVLLAATNEIGKPARRRSVKKLASGLVVPGTPRLPRVDADECALIARKQNDAGKIRVDPKILVIVAAGRATQTCPRFATIRRPHRHDARAVDDIGILGIDARHRQIPSSDAQSWSGIRGDANPVLARIVGTINPHARLVGRDRSVEPAGLARRDGHVYLNDSFRQPIGELTPRFAAVGGFENSSTRSAVLIPVLPRPQAHFPKRSVNEVGIRWVDLHIGAADVRVFRKNSLPVLAAISREINPALVARPVGMTESRGENAIGIVRVDRQRGNALRVAQAEVLPRPACVGGLVNPVANGKIGARQAFAAANVNDVRIGRRHRDRADGLLWLAVNDGIPRAAKVC